LPGRGAILLSVSGTCTVLWGLRALRRGVGVCRVPAPAQTVGLSCCVRCPLLSMFRWCSVLVVLVRVAEGCMKTKLPSGAWNTGLWKAWFLYRVFREYRTGRQCWVSCKNKVNIQTGGVGRVQKGPRGLTKVGCLENLNLQLLP